MLRRAALVFNPVAGRGQGDDLATIRTLLDPHFDLTVHETSPEQDSDVCAKRALDEGFELIFASGGDGTVSAVASVVAGSAATLGIIPRGTANSISRALELPLTLEDACAALPTAEPRRIDTARCGERAILLVAGIGFHADTIDRTTREAKNTFGLLAYFASGLAQLSDFTPFHVELDCDDKTIRCEAIAVTVANAAPAHTILAQGPARVIPDDGLLDVTIVAAQNLVEAVFTGLHLYSTAQDGTASTRDNVGYFRCRRLTVDATPAQKLMIDGETVATTPFTVECLPGSLSLLAPPRPATAPPDDVDRLARAATEAALGLAAAADPQATLDNLATLDDAASAPPAPLEPAADEKLVGLPGLEVTPKDDAT